MTEADKAVETPLHELLAAIPIDARLEWEDRSEGGGLQAIHLCPIGLLAHRAAEALASLERRVRMDDGTWSEPDPEYHPLREALARQAEPREADKAVERRNAIRLIVHQALRSGDEDFWATWECESRIVDEIEALARQAEPRTLAEGAGYETTDGRYASMNPRPGFVPRQAEQVSDDAVVDQAKAMLHRRRLDALALGGSSEISVEEIDSALAALTAAKLERE